MVISIFVAKVDDNIHLKSLNTIPLHYLYNKHKKVNLLQFVALLIKHNFSSKIYHILRYGK